MGNCKLNKVLKDKYNNRRVNAFFDPTLGWQVRNRQIKAMEECLFLEFEELA